MASLSVGGLFFVFLAYLSAAHAFHGPICRSKSVFPYMICGASPERVFDTYDLADEFCGPKEPLGCKVEQLENGTFSCSLDPEANNPCSHDEIPASDINLTPGEPVSVNLRLNPWPPTVDVVLLIDASETVKPHFQAIKPKLISFLNNIETSWALKVGVGIYGPEGSLGPNGISALSAVDSDVSKAIEALDRVPEFPDGPRTTLGAIWKIRQSDLQARAQRQVVFLIGDSPGREPECVISGMTREGIVRDVYGYSSSVSIIPVSLGSVGLDASLPEPEACPGNPYISTAPIAAGQATYLAENTGGVVIDDITPEVLYEAFDTVRRNPPRPLADPPGSSYGVTTASVPLNTGPFSVPDRFQRYSNGCESDVSVEVTNLPDFISPPNVVIAGMKLTLKPGICARGGPFTCEIRVLEHVNTAPIPNVWNRPLVKTEIINVHAC